MEKKRLRTITLLFSKKIVIRKIRTITTKNEKKEIDATAILRCIKKYTPKQEKLTFSCAFYAHFPNFRDISFFSFHFLFFRNFRYAE